MDYMTYQGNRFEVEDLNYWYRGRGPSRYKISVHEISGERVCLPETYCGGKITEWRDQSDRYTPQKRFEKVKVLHIPASIKEIRIDNEIFPDLEKVEIDPANPNYYTDGRLIITRKDNKLVYCPVCKGTSMEIPEYIREICDDAFEGTQYEEIKFSQKKLRLSSEAFRESRWLKQQKEIVIIGDMLYRFPPGMEHLTVPESVRRFHPSAFSDLCPRELTTPILPVSRDIMAMNGCRSLELTSKKASVNITSLRKWKSLEKVTIAEGHKKYRTSDGIIYSRDGKKLVWYPCSKRGETFQVPDSVQKIGEFAFAEQKRLKEIILPESVTSLGIGAFLGCRALQRVVFPSGIKEIPDSGAYQRAGMFERCPDLKSVELPKKMTYLGSYAFYQSGLQSIVLGENLEQIGEYALMAEGLKEISLPPGVKRLGKGSLFYAEKVEAYEGAAKGLVAAVNTSWPGVKDNSANLKWKRCRITVLHKRSGKQDDFLIPESLKKSAACHLENAWNGDSIDYEEYDQCLDEITDSEEKLEFAEQGLLRSLKGEDNVYTDYIRSVSFKIGHRLLEGGKEKEFLQFLKQDFLSENSLVKLLKYSNERGETVCSAYITETLSKKRAGKKKTGGFRI